MRVFQAILAIVAILYAFATLGERDKKLAITYLLGFVSITALVIVLEFVI